MCLVVSVCLSLLFGAAVTLKSFDPEASFFVCGYVCRISRFDFNGKVIGSRSQEQKNVSVSCLDCMTFECFEATNFVFWYATTSS